MFERGGWFREGLAAAAEDLHVSYSYRGMAAQWQAEGTLLPLDSLVSGFYRQDDLAAYLQAGTFVHYLLETYGNALPSSLAGGRERLRAHVRQKRLCIGS